MSYTLYPDVKIGANPQIEDFSIIGLPPKGGESVKRPTTIGDNLIVRSHTVIYAGNQIGNNFRTGHGVLLREENVVGDDVSIGSHSVVEHHVRIGSRVRIHSLAFIPEFTVLEDECWIGPCAVLTNARYPQSKGVKQALRGPLVKKGAIVGANATILPGLVIGVHSIVGAGAVVVKDVPPGRIVAGTPARIINDVDKVPAYESRKVLP